MSWDIPSIHVEENGNKCRKSALDPVMDGRAEKCRITCTGEVDRKYQQGKFGEVVEMEVEEREGTPLVKEMLKLDEDLLGWKRQESAG